MVKEEYEDMVKNEVQRAIAADEDALTSLVSSANRGLVEFIEILKLDVAFLYDLLGVSQEHKIKPKKFADTDIDEVILGHGMPKNALFRVP